MTAKTKYSLKLVFGSLIKNDYCVEGAKTMPWWIAVIMFILGTFLPVIPIMVSASNTYGASFVSANVYDYDQALVSCGVQLKTESIYDFKVEDKQLIGYHEGEKMTSTWTDNKDLTPVITYNRIFEGKATRVLNVYYTDRQYSGKVNSVTKLISAIQDEKYVIGTDEKYNSEVHKDVDAKKGVYLPSYLILFKDGLYSKVFKANTTSESSSTYGGLDWKHADFSGSLLDRVTTVEGKEINVNDRTYVEAAFANWKKVFNDSYKNQKVNNFWMTSGMYFGIYLVLAIFMGLMMFLLTRGKANPNRGLNFWITTKISWWADVTPGILALILGFVWSQAAGLGFIVLFGIRIMWLSMRQLSPQGQQ